MQPFLVASRNTPPQTPLKTAAWETTKKPEHPKRYIQSGGTKKDANSLKRVYIVKAL